MFNDPERDKRLDKIIEPEAVEALFSAAIWAAAARRGIPPDEKVPSIRREALQKLYKAGFERGKRYERDRTADDGK